MEFQSERLMEQSVHAGVGIGVVFEQIIAEDILPSFIEILSPEIVMFRKSL